MKTGMLVVALGLLVAACATGYKPDGLSGGYSETRLNENTFQVSFRGNGLTKPQRAVDFSLLRCADLALENDFQYFIVVTSQNQSQSTTITTPKTTETTANVEVGENIWGDKVEATGHQTTTTSGGETYAFTFPALTNLIVCFKEKPQVNGTLYDARILRSGIRAKYGIK